MAAQPGEPRSQAKRLLPVASGHLFFYSRCFCFHAASIIYPTLNIETPMLNTIRALFGYTPTPSPPPAINLNEIDGDPTAAFSGGQYRLASDPDEVLRKVGWHRADLAKLTTDEELYQCMQARRSALASQPWDIEPNSGAAYEAAVAALREPIDRAIDAALDAVFYGYSITELVVQDGTVLVIPCDIRYFTPTADGLVLMTTGSSTPIDTTLKFIATFHRATRENPQGDAVLSRAYWPVTHRNELWRNWLLYTELFAWPLVAGRVRNPQAFVAAMADQGYKSSIAVGQEDDVKALSVPAAGEFSTQDTALIRRIQRLILGQTGTSGLQGGGSYSAVEVLSKDVLGALTASDRKIATGAAEQVLRFAEVADIIPAGFKFVWRDEKRLSRERADRDEVLARAGVKFTEQYYLDRYDFAPGDFELQQTQPQVKLAATGMQQIDRAAEGRPQPLDLAAIQEAIELASNPADLRDRLAQIVPDPEFAESLARVGFGAQILGWDEGRQ